jgi:hypothetical protein
MQTHDINKFTNVEFDGVDPKDYPDFCDAYITSATYDGAEMSNSQLDEIDSDIVHELLLRHLF